MKKERMMFALIFLLLFALPAASLSVQTEQNAVIITIDGLRPDAIDKNRTPNLKHLIKQGSYTPSAETDKLAKTLPAHTSLITGLKSKNHGMEENKYRDGLGTTAFPTIFSIARENGLSTVMVTGKRKLTYIYPEDRVDTYKAINKREIGTVSAVTEWYLDYIKGNKPRLSLIHFPYPDIAGHSYLWMSEEYFLSLEIVDKYIGDIIEGLKKEGIYKNTFIVITSDHGGEGKTHGKNIPNSHKIPWLAVGNNVKKEYVIEEQVYIYDTAPTVLKVLGLPVPENIDGRVINEIFTSD